MSKRDVVRKIEKPVLLWSPRVQSFVDLTDNDFIRVVAVVEWLDERYVTFRPFKRLYKRELVGKCLHYLGHQRYTKQYPSGWVYKRVRKESGEIGTAHS